MQVAWPCTMQQWKPWMHSRLQTLAEVLSEARNCALVAGAARGWTWAKTWPCGWATGAAVKVAAKIRARATSRSDILFIEATSLCSRRPPSMRIFYSGFFARGMPGGGEAEGQKEALGVGRDELHDGLHVPGLGEEVEQGDALDGEALAE